MESKEMNKRIEQQRRKKRAQKEIVKIKGTKIR